MTRERSYRLQFEKWGVGKYNVKKRTRRQLGDDQQQQSCDPSPSVSALSLPLPLPLPLPLSPTDACGQQPLDWVAGSIGYARDQPDMQHVAPTEARLARNDARPSHVYGPSAVHLMANNHSGRPVVSQRWGLPCPSQQAWQRWDEGPHGEMKYPPPTQYLWVSETPSTWSSAVRGEW